MLHTHTSLSLSISLTCFNFPGFSFIPFFSSAFASQHTYLSLSLSASYFEHVCFFKKIITSLSSLSLAPSSSSSSKLLFNFIPLTFEILREKKKSNLSDTLLTSLPKESLCFFFSSEKNHFKFKTLKRKKQNKSHHHQVEWQQ